MNATRKTLLQRGAGMLLGAPLLAGLGAAAMLPGLRDAELQKARAEGIPIEPEDLRPTPPIPLAENAGPILTDLARQIGGLPDAVRKAWYDPPVELLRYPGDETGWIAFVEGHQRHADLVALAEKAAALPRCDFAYDWSRGLKLVLPELAVARHFARLFAARAWIAESPEDAAEDIARAAHMGNLMAQTPTPIHALVYAAIHAIADGSLRMLAQRAAGDAPALTALRAALPAFGAPPAPTFFLGGEVILARTTLRQMRAGSLADESDEWPGCGQSAYLEYLSQRSIVLGDAWERRILAYWRAVFAALRAHPDDPTAQCTEAERLDNTWSVSKLPDNALLQFLMPGFGSTIRKVQIDTQVRRALRETSLDLLLRHATDGAFPNRFDTPLDLYAGKPLVYRRDGDGGVLYSVGPDRTDDGGAKKGKTNAPYDLVVRLHLRPPTPEKRPTDRPARPAAMVD